MTEVCFYQCRPCSLESNVIQQILKYCLGWVDTHHGVTAEELQSQSEGVQETAAPAIEEDDDDEICDMEDFEDDDDLVIREYNL